MYSGLFVCFTQLLWFLLFSASFASYVSDRVEFRFDFDELERAAVRLQAVLLFPLHFQGRCMSIYFILGTVCCVFAVSSGLLIGLVRSAPLLEDLDARPTPTKGAVRAERTHRKGPAKNRSTKAGVHLIPQKAHASLQRSAVQLPR